MVSSEGGSSNSGGGELMRRKVLGLGYWVQGFRCFPWLAVNFFLKDGLNVDPSTLQLLQNSANLPMVGKPLYGLVSDSVYISGQHRLPYIALGGSIRLLERNLLLNTKERPNKQFCTRDMTWERGFPLKSENQKYADLTAKEHFHSLYMITWELG